MTKFKNYLLLGIIVAVGLGMRIFHNLDISLWHDEAFSALLIKYPWGEMMHRIGLDVHPPMYYIALRFWSYIFGDSLAALRGFSIFFGTATIIAVYELVRTAFSEATSYKLQATSSALTAALLVAINPFQIGFSLEARMYTFGAFLAVLAAYFLVRALSSIRYKVSGIYYALFSITSGLAILTHYYLIFTIAALCLYGLVTVIRKQKAESRIWIHDFYLLISSYLLIAISFLPWLKIFFFQFKQVGNGYWIPKMDLWSMPSTIYEMLVGTGVDVHKTSTQIILILVTTAIVYITISFLRKSNLAYKGLVIFAWLAPFVGSLLFAVLAKLKGSESSVYLIRYFAFSAPFFSIMLAMWLGEIRNRKSEIGSKLSTTAYCLLLTALLLANLYTFFHYWKELNVKEKPGMKAAVELLKNNTKQGDILVVGSSFEFFNLKYYLNQLSANSYQLTAKLYSGGQTTIDKMPHFAGTAILTNEDLLPNFESIDSDNTVWLLWTNGFGGNKPEVPSNWTQEEEHGFAEVRPYVGTWIVVDKYKIK